MSTENSDSDSSISKVEIPNDDLIVQILARLDGPAYNQALYQDASTINQKFLAPPSFPWSGKSAFVLFYHTHLCIQYEVLMIWLFELNFLCLHLLCDCFCIY